MEFFFRAEDEARTRDLNLGKVALYQLSYFRIEYDTERTTLPFLLTPCSLFRLGLQK